jgi:hypothetical protein
MEERKGQNLPQKVIKNPEIGRKNPS